MSRGLGINQRLVIAAMQELHRERGTDYFFAVGYILNKTAELAHKHHPVVIAQDEQHKVYQAEADRRRAARCKDQSLLDLLAASIRSSKKGGNPLREETWIDQTLNISRTLTSLEKRGIIERFPNSRRGKSLAALTDQGLSLEINLPL